MARQNWSSFLAKDGLFMPWQWCDVAENGIPSIGHEEHPPHSCRLTLGPYPGGNEITETSASISWPPIVVSTYSTSGQSSLGADIDRVRGHPVMLHDLIAQVAGGVIKLTTVTLLSPAELRQRYLRQSWVYCDSPNHRSHAV